jgi:hypothetical protein
VSGVSNWRPKRSAAKTDSHPETPDQNWDPRRPGAQDPKDETRFHSRITRRAKKVRLPAEELEKWELWCAINKLDFQDLVTESVRFFLEEFGSPGAQAPTDHDLDDQNDDEEGSVLTASSNLTDSGSPGAQNTEIASQQKAQRMVAFYSLKTGNRIKDRDYEAYNEVASLSESAIKFGIMQSRLLCKTKPNSFAYCLGAIREAADAGVSAEIAETLARTFQVRMQMKASGKMDYDEYFAKLRQAGQRHQPRLPNTGGELKEFEK